MQCFCVKHPLWNRVLCILCDTQHKYPTSEHRRTTKSREWICFFHIYSIVVIYSLVCCACDVYNEYRRNRNTLRDTSIARANIHTPENISENSAQWAQLYILYTRVTLPSVMMFTCVMFVWCLRDTFPPCFSDTLPSAMDVHLCDVCVILFPPCFSDTLPSV